VSPRQDRLGVIVGINVSRDHSKIFVPREFLHLFSRQSIRFGQPDG